MPVPIKETAAAIDLTPRFSGTSTVVASPAAAAETTIASITLSQDVALIAGVRLQGWAAFTVGTNGVSATLKIRRTDTSGTTVVTSGAMTVVAGNLVAFDILGADAGGTIPGQVYVLTLTIGSGSAASTVSAVHISASIF